MLQTTWNVLNLNFWFFPAAFLYQGLYFRDENKVYVINYGSYKCEYKICCMMSEYAMPMNDEHPTINQMQS